MARSPFDHLCPRPKVSNRSNYSLQFIIVQAASFHSGDVAELSAIVRVQNQRWANELEDVDQRDRNLDNTLRL